MNIIKLVAKPLFSCLDILRLINWEEKKWAELGSASVSLL